MVDLDAQRRPEMLVFEVDGRRFGLPATDVRELQRVVTIVPVPWASGAVEGVINLRGSVVPVLDIRALLKLPAKDPEVDDQLVVVEAGRYLAALRVDRVLELTGLDEADHEHTGGLLPSGDDISGVAKLRDGLVLILNVRNLAASAGSAAMGSPPPDFGTRTGEGQSP